MTDMEKYKQAFEKLILFANENELAHIEINLIGICGDQEDWSIVASDIYSTYKLSGAAYKYINFSEAVERVISDYNEEKERKGITY